MKFDKIKVVDATLRDGGLVNDFYFNDKSVKALYNANVAAGIDYMEFGYRASKRMFDPACYGKWKFTSDEDIYSIIEEKNNNIKIAVMVDVGRTDYKEDIVHKKYSPVDLFRVATYIDDISEAVKMINYINSLGYETTCNIMAISKCSIEQITDALKRLAQTQVLAVYMVDSYGAIHPKQIRRLTNLFKKILTPEGIEVGIHAHNNQQCAFANTIEAYEHGAKWLDGTASGLGRGAGNCHSEALIAYLAGNKYNIEPILSFLESWMPSFKEEGIEWGYNTSYLLTGIMNMHPRTAINATKNKDTNFVEQYKNLLYQ